MPTWVAVALAAGLVAALVGTLIVIAIGAWTIRRTRPGRHRRHEPGACRKCIRASIAIHNADHWDRWELAHGVWLATTPEGREFLA